MKKKIIYALLACIIMSCSACGQTETPEPNESAENSEIVTEESCTSEQPANIKIDMQTVETNETDEDGTPLFTKSYTYPVITIEGNEAAAEKINSAIQAKVDSFIADTSTADYAKEDRQFRLESGDTSFMEYSEDYTCVTTRCDTNVISFEVTYYTYTGGAHGNYGSYGLNYNANTGEVIDFSELADNAEKFHADTLAYNQMLASSEGYVERLYSPEIATSEDLEATLYAEGNWYFSTSGLVFISNPYMLGPYASGAIEFMIPYTDLTQMGLKEEYSYLGNLRITLQDGSSYTLDINGDGQEDDIRFYTESTSDAEGNYTESTHLIINDIDLLQGNDTQLKDTFKQYAWGGYTLYDMDATDETVELAFYSYEEVNGEFSTYSNLYRYEKAGTLTYLGKIEGDIRYPLVDISSLMP